jgi:hypothetical protein
MSDYQRLADQALPASNDSLFVRWHDDRIGNTHAVILGAEVGDPYGESNLAAATRILGQWLTDDDEADVLEATVGRSGRTWLRTLAVRVYEADGTFTDAWCTAVDNILLRLEDYPLLDEDDYSEREYLVTHENLTLDYGGDVDLVIDALERWGRWSLQEYVGRHDEVIELVEHHVASLPFDEVDSIVLDGLRYYVEQRKDDLDIPVLSSLLD